MGPKSSSKPGGGGGGGGGGDRSGNPTKAYMKPKFGESYSSASKFAALDLDASSSDGGDPAEEKLMYKILGVHSSASQQDITRAYRNMALRLHPDKNPTDHEAKGRFQLLQKVMCIVGDVEKRAMYDRTGYVEISPFIGESPQTFMESCKAAFKKIIEDDHDEFRARYIGSESEKNELKDLYEMFEGDIDRLFLPMFFAEPNQDSHRFKKIIDDEISKGFLVTTALYQKRAARISVIPNDPSAKKRKEPGEYVGEQFSGRTFVKITGVMNDTYSKQYLGFLSASHTKNNLKAVECFARVYESKSDAKAYYNLMCRCSHENILHATDFAENEEFAVITFDPVEETLESYIMRENQKLCTERTRGYIVEFGEDLRNKTKCIIGGLAYLHSMGIYHGDLNLEEIYVTKSGVIKLGLVERESCGKRGRYSIVSDMKSLGRMYQKIVDIVNEADDDSPYWRNHMNDFCREISNGRYTSAIDLQSHTLLYSPLQKESLLINSHSTRNLRLEQTAVGSSFTALTKTRPWRTQFMSEIAQVKDHDTYDDDLYYGYRRFCRNSLIHLNDPKSYGLKGLLKSKTLALRAFEAYYPPLLYELANFLYKNNKLSDIVHL